MIVPLAMLASVVLILGFTTLVTFHSARQIDARTAERMAHFGLHTQDLIRQSAERTDRMIRESREQTGRLIRETAEVSDRRSREAAERTQQMIHEISERFSRYNAVENRRTRRYLRAMRREHRDTEILIRMLMERSDKDKNNPA